MLADPHILQVTVGALKLLDEVVDVVATAAGEERDGVQRVHGLVVVMAPAYELAVYLRHGLRVQHDDLAAGFARLHGDADYIAQVLRWGEFELLGVLVEAFEVGF